LRTAGNVVWRVIAKVVDPADEAMLVRDSRVRAEDKKLNFLRRGDGIRKGRGGNASRSEQLLIGLTDGDDALRLALNT